MASQQVEYVLTLKDLLTSKLREADSAASGLESAVGRVQSAVVGLGAAIGISFGISKIIDFTKSMVAAGSTVENARIGLTTLLRDANEASQVINNTMQDATRTPFAFEGLLAANKALISTGMSAGQAREDVLNLSNAIAATGGGDDELQRMVVNLQQIRNTGKATALDIRQFAYAGVNVYEMLARATGKTTQEVQHMEVTYDMLSMALKKAHEAGGIYANGLENMSQATSVKISNIGDSFFQLMVKMFDDLKPIIDPVLNMVGQFVNSMKEGWDRLMGNKDSLVAFFKQTMAFFQPLINVVKGLFGNIWNGLKLVVGEVLKWKGVFMEYFNMMKERLVTVFGWVSKFAEGIFGFIGMIMKVIRMVYMILEKLKVIWLIKTIFEGVWQVIKWIGDGLVWLYDNILKPIIDGISWAADAVSKWLGDDNKNVGVVVATKKMEEKTTTNAPDAALPKAGGAGFDMPSGGVSTETKGATASRAVTITVNIQSLVKEFTVKTTNIKEGASRLREMVTEALISATNDAQLMGGM